MVSTNVYVSDQQKKCLLSARFSYVALHFVPHFVRDSQVRWHLKKLKGVFPLNTSSEAIVDAEIVVDN